MRVLIADDETEIASALAEFVESCGHEVLTVTSGGLDVLTACDRFNPNVILMDIMMPHFNGITVCHALAGRRSKPKIVLFSGKLDSAHPFVAGSGASKFLQKPVQFEQIKNVLDELWRSLPAAV